MTAVEAVMSGKVRAASAAARADSAASGRKAAWSALVMSHRRGAISMSTAAAANQLAITSHGRRVTALVTACASRVVLADTGMPPCALLCQPSNFPPNGGTCVLARHAYWRGMPTGVIMSSVMLCH